MVSYNVFFSENALADLRSYPVQDQQFIVDKILAELQTNPFPRGKTIKKLSGKKHKIYRLRINALQSYRAFYGIAETIIVYRIVPKKDADKIIRGL